MNPESRQSLTDAEREITNYVVQKFLKKDEVTSRRELLRELKPLRSVMAEALRHLTDRSVLNIVNNTYLEETFSPKAVAFHYCGDSEALTFAKKSTEIILQTVRNLYDRELDTDSKDRKQFTREDAEAEGRAIDPTITSDMVRVGLALAEEFSIFEGLQRDSQQVGVTAFRPGQRVFELGDNAWDEHIRRSGVSLEGKPEQQQVEVWDAPNSAAGLETYAMPDNRKIFLVHGHAEEPKHAVAGFLRSVGLEVIILHEKPNEGKTIIEKFEKHSDVGLAVVLLTPDDIGASAEHPTDMHARARQNVILELGYFMGKLGRGKVCCLYVEGVEKPSDYDGVLYVPYGDTGKWRDQLAKELTAAGMAVDSEKLQKVLTEQPKQTTTGTELKRRMHEGLPNLKLDHAPVESRADDPVAERRQHRVRDEMAKLPEYSLETLRLLLEFPSLTDYTALQKLGQLARQNSLGSVLPGLQNQTGLIRIVPGQPSSRRPEYELSYEITPELRPFVERYLSEMR